MEYNPIPQNSHWLGLGILPSKFSFFNFDNSTAAALKEIRKIIDSYGSKAWRAAVHRAAKNRHD